MAHCPIEVPSSIVEQLGGTIHADIYEDGGKTPTNILTPGAHYDVVVSVELTAQLKRFMCGHWCICVASESIGPASEKRKCVSLEMTNCDDEEESVTIPLPEDWFGQGDDNDGPCGDVFNLAVTVVGYNKCEDPIGIAGFCQLGPVMIQP
ncbi:MAG: hypothetical protein ACWA5X_11280 [bacterium]